MVSREMEVKQALRSLMEGLVPRLVFDTSSPDRAQFMDEIKGFAYAVGVTLQEREGMLPGMRYLTYGRETRLDDAQA